MTTVATMDVQIEPQIEESSINQADILIGKSTLNTPNEANLTSDISPDPIQLHSTTIREIAEEMSSLVYSSPYTAATHIKQLFECYCRKYKIMKVNSSIINILVSGSVAVVNDDIIPKSDSRSVLSYGEIDERQMLWHIKFENVKEINLNNNYIGNCGLVALCEFIFRHLSGLQRLHLSRCNLYSCDDSPSTIAGTVTLECIFALIKGHPSLSYVDISHNSVGTMGYVVLARFIRDTPEMREVNVDGCLMSDGEIRHLQILCEGNVSKRMRLLAKRKKAEENKNNIVDKDINTVQVDKKEGRKKSDINVLLTPDIPSLYSSWSDSKLSASDRAVCCLSPEPHYYFEEKKFNDLLRRDISKEPNSMLCNVPIQIRYLMVDGVSQSDKNIIDVSSQQEHHNNIMCVPDRRNVIMYEAISNLSMALPRATPCSKGRDGGIIPSSGTSSSLSENTVKAMCTIGRHTSPMARQALLQQPFNFGITPQFRIYQKSAQLKANLKKIVRDSPMFQAFLREAFQNFRFQNEDQGGKGDITTQVTEGTAGRFPPLPFLHAPLPFQEVYDESTIAASLELAPRTDGGVLNDQTTMKALREALAIASPGDKEENRVRALQHQQQEYILEYVVDSLQHAKYRVGELIVEQGDIPVWVSIIVPSISNSQLLDTCDNSKASRDTNQNSSESSDTTNSTTSEVDPTISEDTNELQHTVPARRPVAVQLRKISNKTRLNIPVVTTRSIGPPNSHISATEYYVAATIPPGTFFGDNELLTDTNSRMNTIIADDLDNLYIDADDASTIPEDITSPITTSELEVWQLSSEIYCRIFHPFLSARRKRLIKFLSECVPAISDVWHVAKLALCDVVEPYICDPYERFLEDCRNDPDIRRKYSAMRIPAYPICGARELEKFIFIIEEGRVTVNKGVTEVREFKKGDIVHVFNEVDPVTGLSSIDGMIMNTCTSVKQPTKMLVILKSALSMLPIELYDAINGQGSSYWYLWPRR